MDLCLAWLCYRGLLRGYYRTDWSDIPHFFPRCVPFQLRNLGCSLARLQPSCYGMYLVWRTSLDRRRVRQTHDLSDLAILHQPS